MLTLDEAVAKYKLARDQLTLATAQATIPELRNRFPECQAALDAAVRDVALAAVNWPTEAELESYPIGSTAETAIHAALGDLPHG